MENEVSPQTKALFIFHFPMTQTNSNLEWALSSNHLKKTGLYEWAADPDTEKHFDTVDHDRLISILREEINDAPTLHQIRSFLKAEVMGGLVSLTTEGMPQGEPLSPVLSNVYLDKFGKELERRGWRFVRYADDPGKGKI